MPKPTTNRPQIVTIQYDAGTTQDGYGQPVQNWQEFVKAWALEFQPVTGREVIAASQVKAESTMRLRIRWMASKVVTAKMRVLYGSRTLDINAALNVGEQNQYVDLFCKEAV